MGGVRVGPVLFQSLEEELTPVAGHLTGHVLNAGCGTRDIAPFLRQHGATAVTRCDISSADPDVIVTPLETLPFEDARFDSALCNAVLEHVEGPERSLTELARVVRPGGHIVVSIPFLQPFHPCPTDYRRYTRDGMAQLGRDAGLEIVEIRPVHSLAQTIGWLLWHHAQERGGPARKMLTWWFVYALTTIWHGSDSKAPGTANTFQAVYRRPLTRESDILGVDWRTRDLPPAVTVVPTMLVPDELRLLNTLTSSYYRGAGAIVDAGTFLGGSTVAMAEGLQRNPHRLARVEKPIHSYDRFEVEAWTIERYFPAGTEPGSSFRAVWERNTAPYSHLIDLHFGDVCSHPWRGGDIEILFIDIAKHWTVCDWVTWNFFPHLIPGRSVVVQQDYLYTQNVAWLYVAMEYYADFFEYVCDTEVNSVLFLNTRRIPPSVLTRDTVTAMSLADKTTLMDRAIARFDGRRRDMMEAAKADFLAQLAASDAAVSSGVNIP